MTEPIPERSWRIYAPQAFEDTTGLVVVFAATRSSIAQVYHPLGPYRQEFEIIGSGAVLSWSQKAFDNGSWDMHVRYRGEPPRLIRAALVVTSPPGLPWEGWVQPLEPLGFPQGATFERGGVGCRDLWSLELAHHVVRLDVIDQGAALDYVRTTEEPFRARKRAIRDFRKAEAFFLDLDRRTTPPVPARWSTREWDQTLFDLQYLLEDRCKTRMAAGKHLLVPVFPKIDPEDLFGERARLKMIAGLLQRLIKKHLYDKEPRDLVDWAFELFATDCLAIQHQDYSTHLDLAGHGAPNGVAYFLFAELALYCLENDVNPAFWDRHLVTFVKTAHVFAENAPELAVGTHYPLEREAFAFVEGRYYPRAHLEELRLEYIEEVPSSPRPRRAFLEDRLTWIEAAAVTVPAALPLPPLSPFLATRQLANPRKKPLLRGGVLAPPSPGP